MSDVQTEKPRDPADPKAAEGTPGYGDQGPAGGGKDGATPATSGAIVEGQDDAAERQVNPGGGSSSTGR